MRFVHAFGLFTAAFFLQTAFLPNFRILGVSANLILCLLIVMSFLYDEDLNGVVLGMFYSLILDIQFSPLIGIAPLCALVVFFEIIAVRGLLYRDNALSSVFISLIATTTYSLLYWLVSAVFGSAYSFFYMLKTVPVLLLSHAVICLVIYLILRKNLMRHPRDRYV